MLKKKYHQTKLILILKRYALDSSVISTPLCGKNDFEKWRNCQKIN